MSSLKYKTFKTSQKIERKLSEIEKRSYLEDKAFKMYFLAEEALGRSFLENMAFERSALEKNYFF